MKDLEHKYKVVVNRVADLTAENERLQKSEAEWKYWRSTAVKACDRAESRLAATEQALTVKERQYETAFRERAEAESRVRELTAENERLRAEKADERRIASEAWDRIRQLEGAVYAAESRLATAVGLLRDLDSEGMSARWLKARAALLASAQPAARGEPHTRWCATTLASPRPCDCHPAAPSRTTVSTSSSTARTSWTLAAPSSRAGLPSD